MRDESHERRWAWGLSVLGGSSVLNAIWMLADPHGWYQGLPAAVPDTGPFNQHFVRDIGSAFLVMGVALVWAGWQPAFRAPLLAIAALFYSLHALVHVADTIADRLPVTHWLIDFPGVYAPAILLVVLTVRAFKGRAA